MKVTKRAYLKPMTPLQQIIPGEQLQSFQKKKV